MTKINTYDDRSLCEKMSLLTVVLIPVVMGKVRKVDAMCT